MSRSSCIASFLSNLPLSHPVALQNGTRSSHLLSRLRPNHQIGLCYGPRRASWAPKRRSSLQVLCIGHAKDASAVTGKSWDKLVLKSETPVLVKFYASWCGPCQMVHRVIDEIATDYTGRLNCFVLDADSDMKVAEDYDIKVVPVVLLFKNGEICDSIVGTMPKEFYLAAVERILTLAAHSPHVHFVGSYAFSFSNRSAFPDVLHITSSFPFTDIGILVPESFFLLFYLP